MVEVSSGDYVYDRPFISVDGIGFHFGHYRRTVWVGPRMIGVCCDEKNGDLWLRRPSGNAWGNLSLLECMGAR